MPATPRTIERQVTSYMEDPTNMDQPNLIHSTAGAQAFGFTDALVTGSVAYGWCVPAIIEALGPAWLHEGWADVRFRRPVYPNDQLTVRLEELADGDGAQSAWSLEVIRGEDEIALVGTFGVGVRSDVIEDFQESPAVEPVPTPDPAPGITLAEVEVGKQLATLETSLPYPAAPPAEASTKQRLQGVLLDGVAYANPAGVSGRMSWFGHATYDYGGPSIHTRTQVQYLKPALVGEPLRIGAVIRDGFERKGHDYIVYDGTVRNATGDTLAHVRHTVIFKVAPKTN